MDGNSPQIASSSNTPILSNLIKPNTNQNSTNHIRSNVIQRTQSPQPTNRGLQNGKVGNVKWPNSTQNQPTQQKSYSEALSRAASSLQNLPQNNLPQTLKNHPIALEMIRLVNVIGLNQQGQKVVSKKLQFQGVVRTLNNPKVISIRKVAMTGKKLTFNQKLQEMQVGLSCSLAAQNRCSFDGKINVKKAKVFEVARQVQITKKFESVKNVTRNAVKNMHNYHDKTA